MGLSGMIQTLRERASLRRKRIRRDLELRRLRRIRKKKVPAYRHCKNCGTELQGMYCHNCGQYALDVEQPFWKYVLQYFENVYQFDGKVWVTLWMLFRRPGFLTTEFNAGKIASYVHPMRLLMFITVLFFLLFFSLMGGKVDQAMEGDPEDFFAGLYEGYSAEADMAMPKDTVIAIVADSSRLDLCPGLFDVREFAPGKDGAADTIMVAVSSYLAVSFEGVSAGTWNGIPLVDLTGRHTAPDEREMLFKERIMGAASGYAPMVALLLTPVLALLLKGGYRKCRMGYMGHFVFSLHLASFFYIVLAIYIFVGEMWQYKGLPWYLFSGAVLLYTVVATHRVYQGTGWVKAVVKTVLLFSVYGFIVALVLAGLVAWLFYSQAELIQGLSVL